jgi:type III pantothenate kinase
MKIAMVSEHASPLATLAGRDAGGQNVHVAALAEGLVRRGHVVEVYTRRDAPEAQQPERIRMDCGVTVVHVPVGPEARLPKDELLPLMDDFSTWMRQDWATHGRPDVVHAHFWMSGIAALRACQVVGVPMVQTFHALGSVKRRHQGAADTSPRIRPEVERLVASGADIVVATCSDEVTELERMGVSTEHVRVVPCGVDTDLFCPGEETVADAGPTLLTVGRLVPRKGIDTAVRALARLARGELLVVGGPDAGELQDDPEVKRLTEVALEHRVNDRVRFVGSVPHHEMPALYRAADVVLATPWYEPFGITPVEAAGCGVPVVGSAVGGLLDTIVDGRTGRLVPPHDDRAVGEAVAALLAEPETARSWGWHARRRAVEKYSWHQVAARTEDALHEAVRRADRRKRPGRQHASRDWVRQHRRELTTGMAALEGQADLLESWGARLADILADGGRLLAAGNGGSAAEAQHLTGELVGRFLDERRPLSAVCLCSDTSSLTAILNDYGADEVFARQVEAHGRPGDVLMLLSTSGRSPNILEAARRGRSAGLQVWAMTGGAPNPLASLASEVLVIPARSTAAVQEVQLAAVHGLCAALDAALERDAAGSAPARLEVSA